MAENEVLLEPEEEEVLLIRKAPLRDITAAMIACIGALLMGMTLGYSSPALSNKDFVDFLQTEENKHWFGSLIAIGAIIGGLLGGVLMTKWGLKITMIFCNLPSMVGWLMIIIERHLVLVMIGRILTGVGVGIVSLTVPVYIAEVADKSRRGILGCCFQLLISIGIFLVYTVGMFLPWNLLALVIMGLSFMYGGLLLIVPESPRWLLKNHRRILASQALVWLHVNEEIAQEELSRMEVDLEENDSSSGSFRDMRKPSAYKPTLIAVGLMFFQQMTGINGILFYSASIFANSGFKDNVALPTIIIASILVVVTVISCLLVDRLGRKILFYISGICMVLSMLSFGFFYYITEVTESGKADLNWWSLLSVCMFITAFSIGWSGLPWLVAAEIIPSEVKSIGLSLSTTTNWVFAFLVTKEIDHLRSLFSDYGLMWMFACFSALAVIFVRFTLPETKGKTLEEIKEHFQRRNRPLE